MAATQAESSQHEGLDNIVEYTKTEEDAFSELEWYCRQQFCISGFDKDSIDPVIQRVFPGLSSTSSIHRRAALKVRTNYRNWRFRTIGKARTWINQLLIADQSGLDLRKDYDFKSLRAKMNSIFDVEWIPEIFAFANGAIDFSNCSQLAKLFFQCKYLGIHNGAG